MISVLIVMRLSKLVSIIFSSLIGFVYSNRMTGKIAGNKKPPFSFLKGGGFVRRLGGLGYRA